mmetsp:Transcript_13836/g.55357  ORF Transcript_13836/g.55357 Transcript_13836/m.55357 type:complete len:219 (+) Transcript_13836:746-1402(+)
MPSRRPSVHRIGRAPALASSALQREKGRLPKNPRCAESGDGCGASRRTASAARTRTLRCAWRPQRRNTTGVGASRCASAATTASVNSSHPRSACESAAPRRTVSTAFKSKTPCRAHDDRSPFGALVGPSGRPPVTTSSSSPTGRPFSETATARSAVVSLRSSARTFRSEGGGGTPRRTEKARPCAWPGPWYGSWPRMTALTSARGVSRSARSVSRGAG